MRAAWPYRFRSATSARATGRTRRSATLAGLRPGTRSLFGWELAALPHVSFTQQTTAHGKPTWIPDRLPRLDVAHALASVELPIHLNWSAPGRVFDLRSRADRARVYEIVLQEGAPADILTYVDGVLLVDLWENLVLPRAIRSAWAPLISASSRGRRVMAAGGREPDLSAFQLEVARLLTWPPARASCWREERPCWRST